MPVMIALSALIGCAPADEGAASIPIEPSARCDSEGPPLEISTSPGGTAEVEPGQVYAAACRTRIVDLRKREELASELGVIEGAEHVAARELAVVAQGWDRDEPIVLVCRSGRRSGVATRELQELGFTRVASMTGGMLGWRGQGLPTVEGALPSVEAPRPASARPLTRAEVAAHVADRDRVRWTKAATLMLHGTQACVDGRDAHAIIGTPGGDAGELVLALASAEQVSGRPFSTAQIEDIFDAYLDAFGHFYMHSDEHALAGVSRGTAADDPAAFIEAPPEALRGALLERLVDPAHVGCGHLRSMLQHPDEYGVRPELVTDVLRTFYRRLWAGHPALEFVVLQGDHAESAVVTIELAHEVHGYTRIPLVSPRIADTEVFVVHPQVARFVRRANASFLLERGLGAPSVDEQAFTAQLELLAARQLDATVAHLAADLPHYRVSFSANGDQFEVEGPAPGSQMPRIPVVDHASE